MESEGVIVQVTDLMIKPDYKTFSLAYIKILLLIIVRLIKLFIICEKSLTFTFTYIAFYILVYHKKKKHSQDFP